jgi:hypothetical protein
VWCPLSATDARGFFATFKVNQLQMIESNLQTPDIGWWGYNVYVPGSFHATLPDEVEFMASHAAAWNASQNLETDIGWLQGNGGTTEAFVRARQWRLLLLSPDLRARIRALPEYDFTLVSRPAGWFVQQRYVHPPHECIGTYCQWSLLPAFNSSSSVIVGARLRSLTALPSDGGLSLMLFGEGTRSQAFLTSDPT